MSSLPKHCGCGRTFDVDAWRELPGVGRCPDGEGGELDLRNCPCGSTIAVLVADLQEDDRLAFEVKREEKMARLLDGAEAATDLALRYAFEDRRDGADAREDRRVIEATRQANEYVRAAARLRAMAFNSNDLVLVAAMSEELAAAE